MMVMSKVRLVVGLALGVFLSSGVVSAQEVTLQGKILCARCTLKETPKCQTAIQVKEADKTVTYYFADKGSRESYHEEVCGGGAKDGRVTGTVTKKDGKQWITPSKVEYLQKDSNATPNRSLESALAKEGVSLRDCTASSCHESADSPRRCCCCAAACPGGHCAPAVPSSAPKGCCAPDAPSARTGGCCDR